MRGTMPVTPTSPRGILLTHAGRNLDGSSFDLLVENTTSYKPNTGALNGKTPEGFININLASPDTVTRRSDYGAYENYVGLKFTFVRSGTTTPITIKRTQVTKQRHSNPGRTLLLLYSPVLADQSCVRALARTQLSFFDFDQSLTNPTGAEVRECLQLKAPGLGSTHAVDLRDTSEIVSSVHGGPHPPADGWSDEPMYCSSTYGDGDDNPKNRDSLNEQQWARTLTVTLEAASSFELRYVLHGTGGAGRNFLFDGVVSARVPPSLSV